ncbi:sensor histidine kinase [Chitinophaga japonensis]|uniref:histidine kinase n=1 Tax=Chitinophaga japonensis TaxID=104662 RepID=A0A562SY53_CHIJA|nr:HAMP domain-containing sensor histidine kinase [Chitinophaga japonensis]TWI86279.1 histidine kinase/DNA gyrase B/HSP90-like ATPase [Chitinophaga japonensis]
MLQNLLTSRPRLRQLEAEIDTLKADLAQKETFIQCWAHDMNMPLSSMSVVLEGLKGLRDTEDLLDALDTVKNGILALNGLYNNIWDIARGGTDELKLEVIDVEKWLMNTAGLYKPLAEGKGLQYEVVISSRAPVTVTTDRLRLTRILSNLITNAIKFTQEGRVTIKGYLESGLLHIDVADTGPGIPDGKMEDIFAPFVRLNKKMPGCGLGLAIVTMNMKGLGGVLKVHSIEGKGSTFTFNAPSLKVT